MKTVMPQFKQMYTLLTILAVVGSECFLFASQPPIENTKSNITDVEARPEVPWQLQVGYRITTLRKRIPVVNRVVLVPDEETFLVAINEWSLAGRWPILIEDDYFTPMFIRRFKPKEILKLPKTAANPNTTLDKRMQQAVDYAWRIPRQNETDPVTFTLDVVPQLAADSWKQIGWTPPGIVLTTTKDTAWPGAVALASAYGQPLLFLEGFFGTPNAIVTPEKWNLLNTRINTLVHNIDYSYDTLGDDIDTMTIVRDLPVKYHTQDNPKEILSTTDGLARSNTGNRWAIVGWIRGSATQSLYTAMCSIFLPPEDALLYNSYPSNDIWGNYAMTTAKQTLDSRGMEVTETHMPNTNVYDWLTRFNQGSNVDLFMVNTKGEEGWFDLSPATHLTHPKRTIGPRAYAQDIPILNEPAAVYFIHSWSTRRPKLRDTVAGSWLDRGAYIYIGSVDEPYLTAFIQPEHFAARIAAGIPLLIASRFEKSPPWKIATIGDPLATIARNPLPRLAPSSFPLFTNNTHTLDSLLQTSVTNATDGTASWVPVFQLLNLMGNDEMIIRLYQRLRYDAAENEQELPHEIAPYVLPAMLRSGTDYKEIVRTFQTIPSKLRTNIEYDMLFASMLPHLAEINDAVTVRFLMDTIREPRTFVDGTRLAPHVYRVLGKQAADTFLDTLKRETPNDKYAHKRIRQSRQ